MSSTDCTAAKFSTSTDGGVFVVDEPTCCKFITGNSAHMAAPTGWRIWNRFAVNATG
jgi:hypothetical protein